MSDSFGQGSNQPGSGSHYSDDAILLASSCPKKPAGRKKFKETRHPVYRGVRQRNGNRWVCEVRTPTNNSRIWLGSYPTAEMAARAHDVAALAFKGQSACLNFADSAWRLPVPVSTDSRDIQRAAAEAAELFHPPESDNPTQDNGNEAVLNHGQMSIDYGGVPETSSSSVYMDEEAVFNMPGLMDNMAEALMLPPPPNTLGWDDTENECEVSLWNY